MPVGEALGRLAKMHHGEVAKMRERLATRVLGHDSIQHSPQEKLVTFSREGEPVWTAKAEPLAQFVTDMGILRWWWHGRVAQIPSRLDTIVAEGQTHGVEELVRSAASLDSLETADMVCAIGASLAGAHGHLRFEAGEDWSFYALFDAPGARITIPAPPIASTLPVPAKHAAMSLPPPPAAPTTRKEPARELVSPVAIETIKAVQGGLPGGFQQAMLTVVIDAQGGKARLFVHLAAIDTAQDMVSLDPSQPLFDAVVTMIGEHRRRGGSDMRKLVLRLRRSDRGASVDVTVS
jgi:hypothetical protein